MTVILTRCDECLEKKEELEAVVDNEYTNSEIRLVCDGCKHLTAIRRAVEFVLRNELPESEITISHNALPKLMRGVCS